MVTIFFTEIKDIIIENEAQQLEEFTTFLERTSSCITDDTLHSMKTVLKGMNDVDHNYHMNKIEIK